MELKKLDPLPIFFAVETSHVKLEGHNPFKDILLRLEDKEREKATKISYHPECQDMNLTHLCFADDPMVFVEGEKKSILEVFDEFAIHSGLKIRLENSTLYMAGVSSEVREDILKEFPFEFGILPVRYLGLPLLTRKMRAADYAPLIEKIKLQFNTWTARQLSFAGRLQLLGSVVCSLTNFWMAAFRLPKSCIREIENLCAAFLWSGPDLNSKKAKVAWKSVCTPREEGGLGLKSMEEVNKVCVLKLIWRILSSKTSLWVDWIKRHLIQNNSFWAVSNNATAGSWIWKKLLKYREEAKQFYKVEVRNGYSISFWYDKWCSLGCLFDLFGNRGFIDLGVSEQTTLGIVLRMERRRRHRNGLLNQVEKEITKLKKKCVEEQQDIILWKRKNDIYANNFRSKDVLTILRGTHDIWEQHKVVWFSFATPKFAFVTWLALKNRLSTGERMKRWKINVNVGCALCNEPMETRQHLFFECTSSREIWEALAGTLMGTSFSCKLEDFIKFVSSDQRVNTKLFILRYAFQALIHALWCERNRRRHGEKPISNVALMKMIDVTVRNRLSTMRQKGVKKYEDGLRIWFDCRRFL